MISKIKLILKWKKDVRADGYFVMKDVESNLEELVRIENSEITSITISGLHIHTEYHFLVFFYSKQNGKYDIFKTENYYGYVDLAKYAVYDFPIPKFKKATKQGNTNYIEWESVAEGIHYLVARKTLKGKWERLDITQKTGYIDKNVDLKKYIYTVRCISEDGKKMLSSFSNKGITV